MSRVLASAAAAALFVGGAVAHAGPVQLTDEEMDEITAGGEIITIVDNEHVTLTYDTEANEGTLTAGEVDEETLPSN